MLLNIHPFNPDKQRICSPRGLKKGEINPSSDDKRQIYSTAVPCINCDLASCGARQPPRILHFHAHGMQTAEWKLMAGNFMIRPACVESAVIAPIPTYLQILERIFAIARGAGIKRDQGAAVDIIRCESEGCSGRVIAYTDREGCRKL